jgi:hypothetical protein
LEELIVDEVEPHQVDAMIWFAFVLGVVNGVDEFADDPIETKLGAVKFIMCKNWKDEPRWDDVNETFTDFARYCSHAAPFFCSMMELVSESSLIRVTTNQKFDPRSREELVSRRLDKLEEVRRFRDDLQNWFRIGGILDACQTEATYECLRKLFNHKGHMWKHVINPPKIESLSRAKEEKNNLYSSDRISTSRGMIDVVGDGRRVSIMETRRSWNVRVGTDSVDRMQVLRVGIPAPMCHLFDGLPDWIEAMREISGIDETHWCGQQIFDKNGNKWSGDNEIDKERTLELEFRIEFENNTLLEFAGAELKAAKQMGWVVSVPHITQQCVEDTPLDLCEVFEKCILEMLDRHLMEKCGINLKEKPTGNWIPKFIVDLGLALYVDNVGKSSGLTPVLGLSFKFNAIFMVVCVICG